MGNLPIPDQMKTIRGSKSPIKVVDLVFSSGEARRSTQTIAFNLPNDERVRKEKGSKKVMMKNNIDAKFQHLLTPIAKILMKKKQLSQNFLFMVEKGLLPQDMTNKVLFTYSAGLFRAL